MQQSIQPLACIHPKAKIGQDVTIEPFTTIQEDVEIGEGTWIGPNVTLMNGTRIGKNCRVFPGAVIGAIPQDLKFSGEETLAIIGDNTTIRECVTVNRGTNASGRTTVGSGCLLMAYVHIAHDCIIGNNCILANAVNLGGHVEVADYVIIGGMSAIHQFVCIGAHVIIAGGSLINKDIPPYIKAARFPISYTGLNSVGLRRRGFSNEKINEIQDVYRIIFLSGLNVSQSIEAVEQSIPESEERDEILRFVRQSQRGIMKSYSFMKNS